MNGIHCFGTIWADPSLHILPLKSSLVWYNGYVRFRQSYVARSSLTEVSLSENSLPIFLALIWSGVFCI